MKRSSPYLLSLLGLVLLGAGCGSKPIAVPGSTTDTYGYGTTDSGTVSKTTPATTMTEPTTPPAMDTLKLTFSGKLPDEEIQDKQIRIKTELGDIVFDVYPDTAPLAVSNFVSLANQQYFDGLAFHRRVEGFVLQGGDPFTRTLPMSDRRIGTGGPGYEFQDELKDKYTYKRGIVAMANHGANTNGSQFFIMLADTPLDKAYTIFGNVTSGMEIVDKLQVGAKMLSVTVEDKK